MTRIETRCTDVSGAHAERWLGVRRRGAAARDETRTAWMRATPFIGVAFTPVRVSPWPAASRPAPDASWSNPVIRV